MVTQKKSENMKYLFFIVLLVVIIVSAGCTQIASDSKPNPITNPPSTTVTIIPPITFTPTSTPVIPKDPIIGYWYNWVYPSWGGKVSNEFTFMENQTWNRIISQYQHDGEVEKEYAHGTWKKEDANTYQLTSSITGVSHIFEYTIANDELSDTNFELTFHRSA